MHSRYISLLYFSQIHLKFIALKDGKFLVVQFSNVRSIAETLRKSFGVLALKHVKSVLIYCKIRCSGALAT